MDIGNIRTSGIEHVRYDPKFRDNVGNLWVEFIEIFLSNIQNCDKEKLCPEVESKNSQNYDNWGNVCEKWIYVSSDSLDTVTLLHFINWSWTLNGLMKLRIETLPKGGRNHNWNQIFQFCLLSILNCLIGYKTKTNPYDELIFSIKKREYCEPSLIASDCLMHEYT